MIKLYDATLANALPEVLSEQPWGRGFAAAVRRQQRQLLNLARRISLYAAVDDMLEAVLDVMEPPPRGGQGECKAVWFN